MSVLKHGSLTAAANQLYISQSTISHRIQMLEDELGFPLFVRGRGVRGVELTARGEEFIPIAQQWMALFKDTQLLKDQTMIYTLNIGAVDLVNSYTFIPLYRQHIVEKPNIKLRLRTHHSGELHSMLENRSIDIGFVFNQLQNADIISKPIYRELMYLICSKSSAYHDDITPEELPVEKCVFVRWGEDFVSWFNSYWDERRVLINMGTGSQAIPFLRFPEHWAIVPASIYYRIKNREYMACYRLAASPPPRICYQITHKYPKRSSEWLIETFEKEVEEYVQASDMICKYEPWMSK